MSDRVRVRDWGEPAHPMIVRQFQDLIGIYRAIREGSQPQIDAAFDTVSRQIGFVVTTSVPMTLEVGENAKDTRWSVGEALKGSLFEKAMLEVLKASREPWKAAPGKYDLYLVWYEALKIKLRKVWLEPAHFLSQPGLGQVADAAQISSHVKEPAHWFHPGSPISEQDKVQISALDEVYPELKLADRVAAMRGLLRSVRPDVMEPAHVGTGAVSQRVTLEIAQLLRRVRPEVMEPAHFQPGERDILAEIGALLRKHGV
jgi:hypothetical protein